MTYSNYFIEPIGQFGDNTRHAVRIAQEVCSSVEALALRMRTMREDALSKTDGILLQADLKDFHKSSRMLEELLNTEGQAKHVAESHEGDEVKWQDEPFGSYAAATLAMAHAIQSELQSGSATGLITDIAKGIGALQARLEREQVIVEYLIQTRLGRPPKPSQVDVINAHLGRRRNDRQQRLPIVAGAVGWFEDRAGITKVEKQLGPESGEKSSSQFVPTTLQSAILAALDGKGLLVEQLANKVSGGDTSRLYKPGALKELKEAKLVVLKRGVGYYRPDAPPASTVVSATK